MASEKEESKVSLKYALGVGASIIALLLVINGWLLTKGFDSIEKSGAKNSTAIESLCAEFKKMDQDGRSRDFVIERRIDRMEVLVTMPFDKRIEVLKNLQNMPFKADK